MEIKRRPVLSPSSIPRQWIVIKHNKKFTGIASQHKWEIPLKMENTKTTLLSPSSILFAAGGMLKGILYWGMSAYITANMHPWDLYSCISFLDMQNN